MASSRKFTTSEFEIHRSISNQTDISLLFKTNEPFQFANILNVQTAILTEPVAKGEKVMLMLHAETGGMKTGGFEYTLGAKEDGPVKVDDKLVMSVVEAQ